MLILVDFYILLCCLKRFLKVYKGFGLLIHITKIVLVVT